MRKLPPIPEQYGCLVCRNQKNDYDTEFPLACSVPIMDRDLIRAGFQFYLALCVRHRDDLCCNEINFRQEHSDEWSLLLQYRSALQSLGTWPEKWEDSFQRLLKSDLAPPQLTNRLQAIKSEVSF